MSDCPYCVKIVKSGGLYCSRNTSIKNMADVASGVHVIRARQLEMADPHVTRLSLNFDLTGAMEFEAGSRRYTVNPGKYLLLNAGSSYRSFLNAASIHHTAYVVFKVGLAEDVYASITRNTVTLLDEPFLPAEKQLMFTEKTYSWDPSALLQTVNILNAMDAGATFLPGELDDFYETLLEKMIRVQFHVNTQIASLRFEKQSTRKEIFLRLDTARDFIHDNYASDITLDDMASHACLSVHHFKRVFRYLYGCAPHQYLTSLRLQVASQLLAEDNYAVHEICSLVGFTDPSSFTRLFKSRMEVTPLQYRKNHVRNTTAIA